MNFIRFDLAKIAGKYLNPQQDSLAKLKRQLQDAKADISFTETVKQVLVL